MTLRPTLTQVACIVAAALFSACGSDEPVTRSYQDVGDIWLEANAGEE